MAPGVSHTFLYLCISWTRLIYALCSGMLYCGAFHRIYSLLRTSGVLQRGRRECVLPGYVIGKHEHDRTLGATFSKI